MPSNQDEPLFTNKHLESFIGKVVASVGYVARYPNLYVCKVTMEDGSAFYVMSAEPKIGTGGVPNA